jgi:hypothetical protein
MTTTINSQVFEDLELVVGVAGCSTAVAGWLLARKNARIVAPGPFVLDCSELGLSSLFFPLLAFFSACLAAFRAALPVRPGVTAAGADAFPFDASQVWLFAPL